MYICKYDVLFFYIFRVMSFVFYYMDILKYKKINTHNIIKPPMWVCELITFTPPSSVPFTFL